MIETNKTNLIFFDCDSTLTSIEGLDYLAKKKGLESQISQITRLGMEGKITFKQSFSQRINLLKPSRSDVKDLGLIYLKHLSPNVELLFTELSERNIQVYIVSGGLKLALDAFASILPIAKNHIYGIDLHFKKNGCFQGFETNSPLLQPRGKVLVVKQILTELSKNYSENSFETAFVGDGITDLETGEVVDKVWLYNQHVQRRFSNSQYRFLWLKDLQELL